MHHSVELTDVHVRVGHVQVLAGVNIEAKPCEFISVEQYSDKTYLLKEGKSCLVK